MYFRVGKFIITTASWISLFSAEKMKVERIVGI
jgi:hypothetical protein